MAKEFTLDSLSRIVVAVDPAVTATETSDDTGICVVGRGPHIVLPESEHQCVLGEKCPGHGFILEDATCHLQPEGWAKRVIKCFDYWHADRVVGEKNQGGELVEQNLRSVRMGIPYSAVTASRGKHTRAEPVATLHEQGRLHFLDVMPKLEDQLESWNPEDKDSPDRLDALVWGITFLGLISGAHGLAVRLTWEAEVASQGDKPVVPEKIAQLPHFENLEDGDPNPTCKHRWMRDQEGYYCIHPECSARKERDW